MLAILLLRSRGDNIIWAKRLIKCPFLYLCVYLLLPKFSSSHPVIGILDILLFYEHAFEHGKELSSVGPTLEGDPMSSKLMIPVTYLEIIEKNVFLKSR